MIYRKGSFTIVPNKEHLRGKDTLLQTVFLWICTYADEYGTCYPSRKRLASDCGVSIKSVDRAIKELEGLRLLFREKRKDSKTSNMTNMYYIVIPEHIEELHNDDPSDKKDTRGRDKNDIGTIPIGTIQSHDEASSSFDWDTYLEEMLKNTQRHIKIIGFYFKVREKRFDSLSEVQSAIKRHAKAARELVNFPNSKIGEVIRRLNYEFPRFTLETVHKELTK